MDNIPNTYTKDPMISVKLIYNEREWKVIFNQNSTKTNCQRLTMKFPKQNMVTFIIHKKCQKNKLKKELLRNTIIYHVYKNY